MDLNAPKTLIQKLKLRGFKMIPGHRYFYINNSGDIISSKTGKLLKNATRKENVRIEGKNLSVPKLVLLTFKKQEYRQKNHIFYKDQDRTNFHVSNLKYCRFFNNQPEQINNEGLLTAIRCYVSVNKRFTIKNQYATKFMLSVIIKKRWYILSGLETVKEIFEFYLNSGYAKTAKHFKLNILDCQNTINHIINRIIDDILKDLQAGIITIKPYQERKKTTAQLLKEYRVHTKQLLKEITENQGAKDTV